MSRCCEVPSRRRRSVFTTFVATANERMSSASGQLVVVVLEEDDDKKEEEEETQTKIRLHLTTDPLRRWSLAADSKSRRRLRLCEIIENDKI